VLLDAKVEGFGGSGRSFDWSLANGARRYGLPFWLAGGLTPANVGEAVRQARPVGVDVASGVEARAGVKDAALVRAFVAAVRAAEER
jgi:phosphoribosylanthranilate isomerase